MDFFLFGFFFSKYATLSERIYFFKLSLCKKKTQCLLLLLNIEILLKKKFTCILIMHVCVMFTGFL
jgi:hypothetical protein